MNAQVTFGAGGKPLQNVNFPKAEERGRFSEFSGDYVFREGSVQDGRV